MKDKKVILGKKAIILIAAIAVIVSAAVIGTIAYLTSETKTVTNTFKVGTASCEIKETFDGEEKTNVYVTNTGDVPSFVRAAIIITWKDADGNVSSLPVADTDYTIVMSSSKWTLKDGYYYYEESLRSGGSTANLIDSIKPVDGKVPEGYYLSVDILAQSIQAEPAQASFEAWGYTPGSSN